MDADLIRLILLILGVCLIAGIWLWDRWQRARGEPPMVRRREVDEPEEEADIEVLPGEDADEDSRYIADAEDEAQEQAPVYLDRDDEIELDADAAGPSWTAAPAPEIEPEPEPEAEPEPATEPLRREPAWARPREPVIPAFLMNPDSELPDEPELETETPAEPEPESAFVVRPEPEAQPAPSAADAEPSLVADRDDEPDIPVLELAPEPIHAPAKPARTKPKEPAAKPKAKQDAEPVSIRMDEDQFDLDLGFSAVDDQDLQDVAVDLPDLIVQINIVAKGESFTGEQVLAAMDQVEMRAGEHDIFHRYDNRAAKGEKPRILFSLASLVEPGNFPLKKMATFSTPGLTLFAQLPGPRDGLLIYSDMLYVAERLARLLDARLKDENRSTLTKQTIEHTRERIAEHKRQITLKLRQAGDTQRGRR